MKLSKRSSVYHTESSISCHSPVASWPLHPDNSLDFSINTTLVSTTTSVCSTEICGKFTKGYQQLTERDPFLTSHTLKYKAWVLIYLVSHVLRKNNGYTAGWWPKLTLELTLSKVHLKMKNKTHLSSKWQCHVSALIDHFIELFEAFIFNLSTQSRLLILYQIWRSPLVSLLFWSWPAPKWSSMTTLMNSTSPNGVTTSLSQVEETGNSNYTTTTGALLSQKTASSTSVQFWLKTKSANKMSEPATLTNYGEDHLLICAQATNFTAAAEPVMEITTLTQSWVVN